MFMKNALTFDSELPNDFDIYPKSFEDLGGFWNESVVSMEILFIAQLIATDIGAHQLCS